MQGTTFPYFQPFNASPDRMDLLLKVNDFVRRGVEAVLTDELARYDVKGDVTFARRINSAEAEFGSFPSCLGCYEADFSLAYRLLAGEQIPEPGRRTVLNLAMLNVTTLLTMHWIRGILWHARLRTPALVLPMDELDELLLPKPPSESAANFGRFLVEEGQGAITEEEARGMLAAAFSFGPVPPELFTYLEKEGVRLQPSAAPAAPAATA